MSEETLRQDEKLVGTPRNIVVAGWPTKHVEQIENLLRHVTPNVTETRLRDADTPNPFSERLASPRNPSDVEQVRELLVREEASILFLFIEDIASVLARELVGGADVDFGVVHDWQMAVDRLLGIVEPWDSSIKVIAVNDVFAAPNLFVDYLSDVMAWPLSLIGRPEVPIRGKWDDFYLMIANQYLSERSDIALLRRELEKRRDFVPFSSAGSYTRVDWSAVMQDVESLRSENTVLLEMLHRVQSEYEASMVDMGKKEEQVKQLADEVKQRKHDVAAATATLKEMAGSLAATEASLRKAEKQVRDNRKVAEQLDYSEKARKRAEAQVELVLNSTSWKVTAPMRGLVTKFRD